MTSVLASGKMADMIKMPFGMAGWVAPNNHVLELTLGPDLLSRRGNFCGNAVFRENVLQ